MKNLQIGLEDSVVSYLDRIASEQHKTRTAVIRDAIRHWIRRNAVGRFEEDWIAALNSDQTEYSDDTELWMAAEVFLGIMGNLSAPSFVQADTIHTVPKQSLVKYSGTLDASTMRRVFRKVVVALGLEESV